MYHNVNKIAEFFEMYLLLCHRPIGYDLDTQPSNLAFATSSPSCEAISFDKFALSYQRQVPEVLSPESSHWRYPRRYRFAPHRAALTIARANLYVTPTRIDDLRRAQS